MSMPNIPDIDANINIDKETALSIILASVGFEELGLAHLINAEAEKVQFALGTLEGSTGPLTFEEILQANESAQGILKDSLKMQLLLGMKLEETLDAFPEPEPPVPLP